MVEWNCNHSKAWMLGLIDLRLTSLIQCINGVLANFSFSHKMVLFWHGKDRAWFLIALMHSKDFINWTHFWWLSPWWKVWAGKVEVHCSWHCCCCSLTSWCCWWWWWRGGSVRTGWWKLYFIKFFMEITWNMNFLNTKPDHNILNFLKWKYFYSHEQEYIESVL